MNNKSQPKLDSDSKKTTDKQQANSAVQDISNRNRLDLVKLTGSFICKINLFLTRSAKFMLIFIAKLYQVTLRQFLGGHCKFTPTCSEYFIKAVKKHGTIKGGFLGIWRILRCNPFSKGGFDDVP